MKTKLIATMAAAAGFATASLSAQELTFDTSFGVESEYVFRGVQLAGPSVQGSVQANYADSYFGIWASESLDSEDSNASEFDFYAGWGYALNDTTVLDLGATLYHYPDNDGDDTLELYVGTSFDTALAPSIYLFRDLELDVWTLEGGIGHTFEFDEKAGVELSLNVGYIDADDGGELWYSMASANYNYVISDTWTLSTGVRVSSNDISGNEARDANLWGGLSFSASY